MLLPSSKQIYKLDQAGFTLVELVIIIVVLGIVAAVAIPRFTDMSDASKTAATREEMLALKRAISGNPEVVSGGVHIDRGFEGDVGFVPSQLVDLVTRPDSVGIYNNLTRLGWNGPYIDSAQSNYASDAWGDAYVYQPANRIIISAGGPDSIKVSF